MTDQPARGFTGWQAGALVLLGALLLQACTGSAPARQYRLLDAQSSHQLDTPNAFNQATKADSRSLRLGLWRVELPAELERPEVVSFGPGHKVVASRRELWAGSLEAQVQRILLMELERTTGQRWIPYPWRGAPPALTLRLHFVELGGELEAEVRVRVHWELLTSNGERRAWGVVRLTRVLHRSGYEAYVGAVAEILRELGSKLGQRLNSRLATGN